MRRSAYINLLGLYLGLMLASCAQIVAPTGGDKDFTAPKVSRVSPPNKTTGFNKKKILVEFDEFIQLNTPEELIIVSPPLDVKPTYTNKGRALEIKLNSELQSNTTYTINFSTAVGDNKENNLLKDYNYIFSTGPQLDSGFISGTLLNAFNNKPEKDITVALYYSDSFTDSTIIKRKPVYLSKTDESGVFKITNLPKAAFKLVAFKDENRNLKADKQENIAFTEQVVTPKDSGTENINMRLFKPDAYTTDYIVDTFNREPNKFVMAIYKPKQLQISNSNGNPVYTRSLKTNGTDTFYLFTKMNQGDTAAHLLVNGTPIAVRYKPIFKTEKLSFTLNKQPELNDTLTFRFNNPVIAVDTSRIKLFRDSTQLKAAYLFKTPFEYNIAHNWAEKTSYRLEIGDSAFTDFFNQTSKKDRAVFSTKTAKDYATLLLHIKLGPSIKHQVIVQLMDEGETKIVHQFLLKSSQDINLEYVLPGIYRLKYIFDTNGNNTWDNGDFTLKTQPEKVGYFKENINIKAYWDLEQSILIE